MFFFSLGYWPNIKDPKTFNEKVAYRRLFGYPKSASIVVDKWRVREYVSEKVSKDILNDVFFVFDDPEKIPFDDLPEKYVLKMNTGSGKSIIVLNNQKINKRKIIKQLIKQFYGKPYLSKHIVEDNIKPLILVEKYIEDDIFKIPLEYKFFVFHGEIKFIEVIQGRFITGTFSVNYNTNWNVLDFEYGYPKGDIIEKPSKLNEMISIAKNLSDEFDFCRIDLYLINNKDIKFSEITLTPGRIPFKPRKYDYIIGSYW